MTRSRGEQIVPIPIFFRIAPLRTTNETTEPNGTPLVTSVFHLVTPAALTSRVTSGSTEKLTMSAGLPSATARDWSPEAP